MSSINAALNVVFPVKWGDRPDPTDAGKTILTPLVSAYHTPISQGVFEANWRIISATATVLTDKNVAPSVLNVATLALKDAGRADAIKYGLAENLSIEAGGAAMPLLAEIKRLTMILAPSPGGYEPLPVDIAIARGVLDAGDWTEAEAALVYFMCGLSSAPRTGRAQAASILALVIWGLSTSSSASEYIASLPKSTPDADSMDLPEPKIEAGPGMAIPQ